MEILWFINVGDLGHILLHTWWTVMTVPLSSVDMTVFKICCLHPKIPVIITSAPQEGANQRCIRDIDELRERILTAL